MKRSYYVVAVCMFVIISLGFPGAKAFGEDTYKVGIGDVLQVSVIGEGLNPVVRVAFDGSITFPYIGTVYVQGMSVTEIKDEIAKRLSEGYIKQPVVSVNIVESLSRKVFTYGEVTRIGEVPFKDNMTLLNTLSLAGGVSDSGLYGKLIIKRKNKSGAGYKDVVEVNLNNGHIEDKKIRDMTLQLDDILIVEKNKTFLIQGEALQRGRFVLENGMTVLSALLQVGGVTTEGEYGSIKLRRKNTDNDGKYEVFVESKLNEGVIEDPVVENTLLHPDDILIVEKSRTFLIEGEVVKRGRMILEKDMTVLSALLQAGGVTDSGLYGRIKLRRKAGNESGQYEDILEAKLTNGVIENNKVEDELIRPDDILVVERNETFLIYGEIERPSEYVLQSGMTVFKAITIAGGFTKWGSENKIKILRSHNDTDGLEIIKVDLGDIIAGDANADIQIQNNDIVVVSSGVF